MSKLNANDEAEFDDVRLDEVSTCRFRDVAWHVDLFCSEEMFSLIYNHRDHRQSAVEENDLNSFLYCIDPEVAREFDRIHRCDSIDYDQRLHYLLSSSILAIEV